MKNALSELESLLAMAVPSSQNFSDAESSSRNRSRVNGRRRKFLGHLIRFPLATITSVSSGRQLSGEIRLPGYEQERWVGNTIIPD